MSNINEAEFISSMEVRDKLTDLIDIIRSMVDETQQKESIDYCLELLNKFKNKEIV